MMKKLMKRWNIEKTRDLFLILMVFSITGSTSIAVGRPFLKGVGVTLVNFPRFFYYPIFLFSSFLFYQLFLVIYGWLFGQFNFFWTMEKKMLKRFGVCT